MNVKARKPRSGGIEHVIRAANGRYIRLRLTRKLAMAAFCTECMGFEENPAACTSKLCPLHPFRAKTLVTRRGSIDSLSDEANSAPAVSRVAGEVRT